MVGFANRGPCGRPHCRGLLGVLLWAAVGLWACAPVGEGRPGDVLLVTIDTLRADHLSLYGYDRETTPDIERWFGEGAVFERAFSAEAATSPSVVSLLSGRMLQDHGVRLFYQLVPEEVALVPDLLPAEYETAAFVSNMVLTDEAIGFGERFDHFDDFLDRRESRRRVFERNAEATTNAALLWLVQERDPNRPLFLWVHYIDPHGPYRPPEAWERHFHHQGTAKVELDKIPPFTRLEGVEDALEYVDRYDEEIRYADHQIGRLLDGYARTNDPEKALIVLTADHGETMNSRETWFHHSFHVYDDIVHVPLLVRGPGVEAGRMRGLASGIDVAKTILGFAGGHPIETPGESGIDLRYGSKIDPERTVFFEATGSSVQWRGARRGDEKWVMAVMGEREIPLKYFYDMSRDPLERKVEEFREGEPVTALNRLIETDPDPAGVPKAYRKGMKISAPKVSLFGSMASSAM